MENLNIVPEDVLVKVSTESPVVDKTDLFFTALRLVVNSVWPLAA